MPRAYLELPNGGVPGTRGRVLQVRQPFNDSGKIFGLQTRKEERGRYLYVELLLLRGLPAVCLGLVGVVLSLTWCGCGCNIK